MSKEDFIDSLCKLGLTSNQARVYLSIASKTKIRVHEIAELTGIHEQDIYKILPKLEQTGLITKTTTKPIIIEAIAPKLALNRIAQKQQEILDDAKKNTQEIIKFIKSKRAVNNHEKLKEKVIIFNKDSQSFENIELQSRKGNRNTLDLFGDRDNTNQYLKSALPYFEEDEKTLVKHHVKVRILSRYRDTKNCFSDTDLKQLSIFNIEIKTVRSSSNDSFPFPDYLVRDGKEIWVRNIGDPTCQFKVITTDCMPIVQIAQEHFEKSWQDSNAELIFSTKPTIDSPEKVAPNSN